MKGAFLFMSRYKVEISGIDTSYIEVLSNEEMNQLFQDFHNGNLEDFIIVLKIWMIYFK